MGYTTAADLASGAKAMVAQARFTMEHDVVCPKLFTKMQLGKGNKSQFIPKFGKVTASDLADGIDMTDAQTLTLAGTTHTTDEAGCKIIVTRKLMNQLNDDVMRAAGKVIGNAMQKKIDTDGLALFSGLDSGLSNANTSFSIDYLQAAVTQCYGQSEPVPEPLYVVLHPYQYHEVKDLLATPGTNIVSPRAFDESLFGKWRGNERLFGVPLFIDGNISIDTSDDAYGAVFSKLAFIYLVGWEPDNWVEEDKSLRGYEVGIVADYGMVEEDGTYGRYLLFDATAPTS